MADDNPRETPDGQSPEKKPWYRRVSIWAAATLVAGLTTFASGAINSLLQSGVETLSGPPFSVLTERYAGPCPHTYIIPGSAETVKPPPPVDSSGSLEERDQWAMALGGVDAGDTRVMITVHGRSDQQVILQDLRIEIVSRDPLVSGYSFSGACGEMFAVRFLDVDLDQVPPVIVGGGGWRDEGSDVPVPVKPVEFPYVISKTDPEAFDLVASTAECNCTWRAKLKWISDGKTGEITIDDDGKPFRTHTEKDYASFVSYAGEPLERQNQEP